MKKLSIFLLAMLLSASVYALDPVKIGTPQQCTNSATNPTTAEWLTCTQARAGTTALNPLYTSAVGAGSSANTQWYTGVAWANWKGQNAGVDNLSNSTPAPFVYNLNYGYDGTTWDRFRVSTLGDAYGATPVGLNTASLNLYYDGTNYRRLLGGTLSDNMTQPTLPYNASFLMVWDGAKWDRMSQPTGGTSGASGDAISATQTGLYGVSLNHFYNGTNFQRMTGETWDSAMSSAPVNLNVNSWGVFYNNTLGANKGAYWVGEAAGDSIGSTAPIVLNIGHFFNGTGYQRWKGEAYDSSMTAAPVNPGVNAFTSFFNGSASQYWLGEAWDADMAGTTNPNVNSFNVFRDATGSKNLQWSGALWSADMTVTASPNVNALGVYRDSSTSKNAQVGGEAWDADMAVVNAPSTLSLGVFHDATGNKNQWLTGALWSADMAVSAAPNVNALNVYRDTTGSKNIQWIGEAWDNSMDLVNAPAVLSLGTFYNSSASKGSYWYGETYDDALATTIAPVVLSLGAFWDGSTSRRLTGAALSSDTVASTAVAPYVGSFSHGWNGSNWVRMRLGASNELQTTDISVRPGEDAANGYRKVRIESVYNLAPTKKTTAVDSAGTDIVIASYQVIGYTNYCLYVKNVGGGSGAAFNNLQVQTSPDDTSWTGDLGWTDCDTAASGTTCVYCVSNGAYNYIRAVASTSASDTTADGWLTLNKG